MPMMTTGMNAKGVMTGRLAALVLVTLAVTGCALTVSAAAGGAVVGVVTGGAVARRAEARVAGAAVTVTFSPPRDVMAVGSAPDDTTWVRGAVSLGGRVTAAHGDTLRVALSEARGAAGPATFPAHRQPTTSIVRGAGVTVRVLSRRPALTDGAFVGALAGIVTAFLTLLIACSTTRCLD